MEVELKFKVDEFPVIERRFPSANHRMCDVYYKHPGSLLNEDEWLRVRTVEMMESGDQSSVITYKGARKGDARAEIEFDIGDSEKAKELLEALGFIELVVVDKTRSMDSIKYQGWEVTICYDEVQHLGKFVELEILSDDVEDASRVLANLADNLGLKNKVEKGYAQLMIA
jgi:adenylate cyclase class 2